MMEKFEFISSGFCCFQQIECSDYICMDEIPRRFYGAVNMRFGGKVTDGINIISRKLYLPTWRHHKYQLF